MKYAVIAVRVLLGLGFVIFGLNILVPFMPQPPMQEGTPAYHFMMAAGPTHWMKVVGLFQLFGGFFVLTGRMAPLGLTLLAPVLVNIVAFHALLMNGEGLGAGIVFSLMEIFLIYVYRGYFAGLVASPAKPAL